MVWESGCVVIVMLTPLSENGVKQCHHYWPDEGSDVYHIYEVCGWEIKQKLQSLDAVKFKGSIHPNYKKHIFSLKWCLALQIVLFFMFWGYEISVATSIQWRWKNKMGPMKAVELQGHCKNVLSFSNVLLLTLGTTNENHSLLILLGWWQKSQNL